MTTDRRKAFTGTLVVLPNPRVLAIQDTGLNLAGLESNSTALIEATAETLRPLDPVTDDTGDESRGAADAGLATRRQQLRAQADQAFAGWMAARPRRPAGRDVGTLVRIGVVTMGLAALSASLMAAIAG